MDFSNDATHPSSTSSTLSAVNGICRSGLPVSFRKALAMAPPIRGRLASPMPCGASNEGISRISMRYGASAIRRMG